MENLSIHRDIKGKVLIVDDVPDTLEIIQKLLFFEGYDVITASTGEEGVKKVEEEKPEVVLMDINLPGIDGNEALRRIREINPIQCVIMLTAYATVDNAIQALKAVMVRGQGLTAIWPQLLALFGFTILFFLLAAFSVRKTA